VWLWLCWLMGIIIVGTLIASVLAGAGIVWLAGAAIEGRWPRCGAQLQAMGSAVYHSTAETVGRRNGHR
jgi:hypothetical protein